jgi:hypothetical protein
MEIAFRDGIYAHQNICVYDKGGENQLFPELRITMHVLIKSKIKTPQLRCFLFDILASPIYLKSLPLLLQNK